MEFPYIKIVNTEKETADLAYEFIYKISKGGRIILNGELGSGKTFFIKYACKHFGITNVSSPSFAIVNSYNNSKPIYHFDFYRLKNSEELFDIGFNDYLNNEEAVVFIEWGNLIPDVLPKNRFEINIEILEETKRLFRFNKYD
jgi:tRNA threonylcarbamoyladenosine biosynthesis protein TsaE